MGKKILVCDDDPDILRLIGLRLKKADYDVVYATDGLSAVSKAHKEKPDLIILDIRMPAGDGFSVCERLRKSMDTWDIPIIVVSAESRDAIAEQLEKAGVDVFLQKPFEAAELMNAVHEQLED